VLFLVGALGGSLMALVIDGPEIVSVGASGAIMGLFSSALVCSFHLPADDNRKRLQRSLLLVLVISLLPLAQPIGIHIDIAGHLGAS
jgi:rhomboid protease GluP